MRFRRIVIVFTCVIAAFILFAAGFIGFLTVAEYRPADIEALEIKNPAQGHPVVGESLSVLSWNIGYASLDASQDFFMDGGKGVRPASSANVMRNIKGIQEFIASAACDIVLVQEADIASKRSYYLDQTTALGEAFPGSSVFAYNFRCAFVPFPFPECIGKVSSGLLTLNRFAASGAVNSGAERVSLPNPFRWPIRTANLKRCLLVSRIPLANSTASLVLVNLHLEAYDSIGSGAAGSGAAGSGAASSGREAQTAKLLELLKSEYEQGNYCIAGGDFNQSFPGIDTARFAIKNTAYFVPGELSPSLLLDTGSGAAGWQFAADTQTPSARLLNEPYSGNEKAAQFYVIDGFIISPNVELLAVQTFNLNFSYSDHNPVKLEVRLK